MRATHLLPALLLHQLLLLPTTIPAAEGKGKRRNPLHDFRKTGELMLIKVNKTLEVKTKLLNTTEQCAKRCSRNKGLSFTCKAFAYDRVTKRCHWLSFNSLTNGVRKKQDHAFDLYEKKDYVRNCIIGKGADYKGTISVTKSGIQCQAWNSMIPHEHRFPTSALFLEGAKLEIANEELDRGTAQSWPDQINPVYKMISWNNIKSYRGKDLRENYCRNPRGEEGGPWCFTTSPEMRHEVCDIPLCSEVECMTCNGENYRGPMDHTETGKECQRWDLQRPHKHKFRPERYPDKGFDDNYCRNPDGKLRPWCYTLDPNTPWEFCAIKMCDESILNSTEAAAETSTCIQGQGEGYRGTVSTIWSGIQCQRWDSQFPHQHNITPENFKCKDLRENYCRNPDGSESPWCFTTDPNIRIGYCSQIPKCDVSNEQDCYRGNGKSYMGNLSKTRFGLTCSTWDKNIEDLRRHIQIFREPDVSKLKKNYCRNPDDDFHGPWCYTDDPLIPWDYCPISRCEGDTTPTTTSLDDTAIPCASTKHLRVVNGIPTQTNEGWVVSLTYRNKHICGGTLIKEEWVLTARQCFPSRYKDLKDYKAWLGVHNIKGKGEEKHRQVRNISQLVYGPAGSDLVLLKLSRPAILTNFVEIIRLPISGCTIPEKTRCSVYGWGYTGLVNYDGLLRVANLFILGNEKCNQYLKGKITVNESEICAVAETIGAGPCERDYGGPLVCEQNRLKIVVGVIVPGRGCAIRNRPGIFVRVSYYSRWIHKIMMTYRKP